MTLYIGNIFMEVEREVSVEIFKDGDVGYLGGNNDWWTSGLNPHSYQYLTIDSRYPQQYFGEGIGHPSDPQIADDLYRYMQSNILKSAFG